MDPYYRDVNTLKSEKRRRTEDVTCGKGDGDVIRVANRDWMDEH